MKQLFRYILVAIAAVWGLALFGVPLMEQYADYQPPMQQKQSNAALQKPLTKEELEKQKEAERARENLPKLPARVGGTANQQGSGGTKGTGVSAGQGSGAKGANGTSSATGQPAKMEKMQFYADVEFNIEGTDTIVLQRDVVLHHNGAVVVCDSAVRYSASRFDCFGKVIINQDSTYIYCDKASYDRDQNLAQVFSPLIKVVSGSSTLYTYNFSFNTLDRVGRYWGGATMLQDSNRMESDRGWYHSKTRDIYAVGAVQMTDPNYQLKGDSVRYNTGVEEAEFYTQSYIWNKKGEMVSGLRGIYRHKTQEFDIFERGYVLSEQKELWADSLRYNADTEDAVGRQNVQMRDDGQQVMAFGDYAEWHGAREEGFLTRNPSVASFDREAIEDTLYMRADTMLFQSARWDSIVEGQTVLKDSLVLDSMGVGSAIRDSALTESLHTPRSTPHTQTADSVVVTPVIQDSTLVLDSLSQAASIVHDLMIVDSVVANETIIADSLHAIAADSVGVRPAMRDSGLMLDSLPRPDSLSLSQRDSLHTDSTKTDSLQRITRAWKNVKIWRRDMQAVCDSMVGFSKDSTAHMYVNPVMWNEQNQITADVVDIYSRNKELEHAHFVGNPLMVAQVYGADYNQIKGRDMTTHFKNNEVCRHFVDGNVQTLYYMVDEGQTKPHTFMAVNAVSAEFLIDSQRINRITYFPNPDWVGYPIDKIPEDAPQRLDGFKWESARRPKREDVFSRVIKPSQREEYLAMPRPEFPLTRRIEEHKHQMMGARQWEERFELLPTKATEWLQTIVVSGQ